MNLHNKDSSSSHKSLADKEEPSNQKVKIQKERCKGCTLCVIYCPRKRIRMSEELNNYGSLYAIFEDVPDDKSSSCNSCGFCYLVCPEVAIEVRKEK